MCDMPGNLEDSLAIAALVQCLVQALSVDIDHGAYQHDCHPMMVRQNKWRACRFGLDARLVDSFTFEAKPVARMVEDLVELLRPTSEELCCTDYLKQCLEIANRPSWADRQLAILEETGDPSEIVRRLTSESRVTQPKAAT